MENSGPKMGICSVVALVGTVWGCWGPVLLLAQGRAGQTVWDMEGHSDVGTWRGHGDVGPWKDTVT